MLHACISRQGECEEYLKISKLRHCTAEMAPWLGLALQPQGNPSSHVIHWARSHSTMWTRDRRINQWGLLTTSLPENLKFQVWILPRRSQVAGKKEGLPVPSNTHTQPLPPHLSLPLPPSLIPHTRSNNRNITFHFPNFNIKKV